MNTTSKLNAFRRTLALVGACAAMAVVPPSFAAAQSETAPSVTVRYNDLDLATSAGVDALYQRIAVAATSVCPRADIRDLDALAAAKQCQMAAITRAVRDVNNPKLADVLATRTSHG